MLLMLFLPLIISLLAAKENEETSAVDFTHTYFASQLDSLSEWAQQMKKISVAADEDVVHHTFLKGRLLYKHIEFLTEYYFPASAGRLNGAPLLEAEPAENMEPKYPQGFQVLEGMVYDELTPESRKSIDYEVDNIIRTVNKLKSLKNNLELTDSEILDALRVNLYTLIIKGISGFDAPLALSGIGEATATLESLNAILAHFPGSEEVVNKVAMSIRYLREHEGDFNAFNRAVFIKDYINPLCVTLNDYQLKNAIPFLKAERAVRTNAKTLFDADAWDVQAFAPAGTPDLTTEQVQLGKLLFNDKRLSANNSRSCASCHQPNRAFTDSLRRNETLIGDQKLLRNTPTLLNAALQPSQFYDSRISFLEDQIHDVVTNRAEMNGNLSMLAGKLSKDKRYRSMSRDAYGKEIDADVIRKAVAAYIRSLSFLNSPFDRYMRGDAQAMNRREINGFNLFMGKAKCGTCHFMPLFNGAAPPFYQKIESEVLGVPEENDTIRARVDKDLGKYHLYKIPHQKYSFKTVSVRNAALTAPYMHNGVFRTLEEVVDFYDRGGGAGIGINLDNQTLAPDQLNLSPTEKQELIAFIRALSDRGE
ncbi:MAG TPA: cytochrome c peroxidase [Flavipsychrobacter sp.]|nr:cytochrome c peroxidase [Flavipsychrobacter sp.]